MKQRGVPLFLIIVLVVLLLAGCGTTYALESEAVSEPPELVFVDGLPLYVTPATDEFLNGFAEYLDLTFLEDGELRLVFVSDGTVHNFSLVEIRYDDDGIRVENILFAQKELFPHRPVVATWTEQGDTPHRAVSFTKDGETRYFALEMDHQGVFSLGEFERVIDPQRFDR